MVLENNGWCPICRVETTFTSNDSWLSENYICKRCNSLPRHRALVAVLDQIAPAWKTMAIHESSPTNPFFTRLCPGYSYSFYFEDIPLGTSKGSIRCENLERLTFEDGTFDIFVTQAVLEHVLDPPSALKEIMRVLREGGIHVFSAPKQKHLTRSYPRAVSEGASVRHLCEPIYHGDPVGDGKTLVTWDYGANFDDLAMLWSGYQTSCYALRNLDMGIAGEYSEIFVTRKKESVRTPDYLAHFWPSVAFLISLLPASGAAHSIQFHSFEVCTSTFCIANRTMRVLHFMSRSWTEEWIRLTSFANSWNRQNIPCFVRNLWSTLPRKLPIQICT